MANVTFGIIIATFVPRWRKGMELLQEEESRFQRVLEHTRVRLKNIQTAEKYDFDLHKFRCTYGKHSSEKPQTKAAPSPNKPISAPSSGLDAVRTSCQRCRQGFFCADHGPNAIVTPKPKPVSQTVSNAEQKAKITPTEQKVAPSVPKMLDMDAKQVCKHKGCGKVFTERQNNDTACHYHPGPAIFHDRSRGWACCDVHVKEFDEFLEIPPCTYGWHDSCEDK